MIRMQGRSRVGSTSTSAPFAIAWVMSRSNPEIIVKSATDKDAAAKKIFNNAAQSWNHEFYWHSMAPANGKGGGAPSGKIKDAVEKLSAESQAMGTAIYEAEAAQAGEAGAADGGDPNVVDAEVVEDEEDEKK